MSSDSLLAHAGQFTLLDWAVVIGYLAFTTILGAKLAGKQATIRDFFLGGRKLPWFAVSGSIIATEISAVTFVSVPFVVFAIGGNFTYLQLGLGTILARIIIGYIFVPAFYEREIYSPYDYMGHWLGPRVKQVVTGLFIVGQLLGQGVRVYLTALVLEVVTDGRLNLHYSIWIIGVVAIVWTILGGIATVIWTDSLLFLLFFAGAVVSIGYVAHLVPGGWSEVFRLGSEAEKFRVFDFSLDPTLQFTFWAGIIASTWGSLNAYGTDQLIAQRMFCCKGPRQARWAIIASSTSLLVTLSVLMVGVGLFAYYHHFPLDATDAARVAEKGDRIFPTFIVRVLPPGLTGLIVAAIFAAAISSLDSILAALSQTFISAFYRPFRRRRAGIVDIDSPATPDEERRDVFVSRILIVFWGLALCGMAYVSIAASKRYNDVLNLALSMAGYTGGAMLAGFMLAFLRVNVNDRGLLWSAPLSVVTVFAVAWNKAPADPALRQFGWADGVCYAAAGVFLALWTMLVIRDPRRGLLKTPWLVAGVGLMLVLHHFLRFPSPDGTHLLPPAWPWYIPIGSVVAFVFGYVLGDPRERTGEALKRAHNT